MEWVSQIVGTGSFVPPNKVTNHDLAKIMETSDEWIQKRSGIVSRHWVDVNTGASDLALKASEEALKSAGLKATDLDMIIYATTSNDYDFPGGGCFLQDKLNIPGIPALDIRQQCSGFVYGLSIANQFIKTGFSKKILLVGAEAQSKGLNRTTEGRDLAVLFGDGAGAVVITAEAKTSQVDQPKIIHSILGADGSFAKDLWIPAPGSSMENSQRLTQEMVNEGLHFPRMNGKTVFVHAVKKMSEGIVAMCEDQKIDIEDIDLFLFHQANLRIIQKIADTLKITEEKVYNTIQRFGNTTAASLPLGLNEAKKAGKLKPGHLVCFSAFGSGFAWGTTLVQF